MPSLIFWETIAVILGIYFFTVAVYVLRVYERGVVFRLGRLVPAKGPGFVVIVPSDAG